MAGHSQRLRVAPHRKGLPEGHAPITRELVVPIIRADLIVAIVGVGNKPSDYTDSDVQIVAHLADVAWTIIERKRTEQALQESETRYRKAAETLAEVDRNKNQFMAVLSHELRNPLAPITNSLYILDHAVPGGEQANRAQAVIGRQVGQLARLVDDLLDVTRISHNKIPLQRQRLDLNELVRRTLEDHRPQFEANEVLIELAPAPKPCWSAETETGSRKSLATSCRTPPSSPGRAVACAQSCRWTARASWPWFVSPTPAWAWPRRCWRGCSNRSHRLIPPSIAAGAAWASGWRWSRGWSSFTEARSPRTALG